MSTCPPPAKRTRQHLPDPLTAAWAQRAACGVAVPGPLARTPPPRPPRQVDYDTAKAYLPPDVERVGTSLGSFSLSAALLAALMALAQPRDMDAAERQPRDSRETAERQPGHMAEMRDSRETWPFSLSAALLAADGSPPPLPPPFPPPPPSPPPSPPPPSPPPPSSPPPPVPRQCRKRPATLTTLSAPPHYQAEFAPELAAKCACLDSDPHFWMPLTLQKEDYLAVMGKKGTPADEAAAHYARMAAFAAKFAPGGGGILGCVDVGAKALWWDYGRLELYQTNNLHAAEEGPSPHALRTFLKLQPQGAPESDASGRQQRNQLGAGLTVHPSAVVLNCRIGSGTIGRESAPAPAPSSPAPSSPAHALGPAASLST